MTYKLRDLSHRKFIFKVRHVNEVKNIITTYNPSFQVWNKYYPEFYALLDFCAEHEIAVINFLLSPNQYILTDQELNRVEVDLNDYGIHFKHKLDSLIQKHELEDVYNLKSDGQVISYAYEFNDFLLNYIPGPEEEYMIFDRQSMYRFRDYLGLGLYKDAEMKIYDEVKDGQFTKFKFSGNTKCSKNAVRDFSWSVNEDVIECPVCKKLVPHAYDDYMVQFYKHDGCKYVDK